MSIKRNRHCLGHNSSTEPRNHYGYNDMFTYLRNFKKSREEPHQLVFGFEFSDKEKSLLNA